MFQHLVVVNTVQVYNLVNHHTKSVLVSISFCLNVSHKSLNLLQVSVLHRKNQENMSLMC